MVLNFILYDCDYRIPLNFNYPTALTINQVIPCTFVLFYYLRNSVCFNLILVLVIVLLLSIVLFVDLLSYASIFGIQL